MNPLVKLFANASLVDILNLFLLNPETEFYQSDIAKKTNKALMQVQRTLKILKEIGLISSVQKGRMVYYRAVRSHPAFKDLKHLFLKSVSLGESVRQALTPFGNKILSAFIFGSVAKGNESLDSDIDLFIIADLTLFELVKALSPLSKNLKRELNPTIFKQSEFQERILKKDHFLLQVIASPKLWIIGNEKKFKQLVKRRNNQTS